MQNIHRTRSEYKHLREDFDELASEALGSPIGSDNRNGRTTVENGPPGIQMSWDYEGVARKTAVSYSNELENVETLVRHS